MTREFIILECSGCKRKNYTSTRNKKQQQKKVEIKKFCSACRKRTLHKEGKHK